MKLHGAILGDLAGQPYEFNYKGDYSEFNIHNPDSHFTDDTIMTLATAAYLLGMYESLEHAYKDFGSRYEGDYYGANFKKWLTSPTGTLNDSWGNGCLMRLSPFMYTAERRNLRDIRQAVVSSCMNSHNHSRSIVACLDLLNHYHAAGLRRIGSRYNPRLEPFKKFEVAADKTVKFIGEAYWYSNSTHETIKKVVECGGDTDTNASIVGELMVYTFNDLTNEDILYIESKLDSYLLDILHKFNRKFA